jgi:pimeloyl-ACP methyl ester carboxylesterase
VPPSRPRAPSSEIVDDAVSGVRLAVHDWGGDGPPLLLAHATGFHGMVWSPIAGRLADAGRHVWSFDFRSHGDSSKSPVAHGWDRFGDDVRAVAEHLGVARDPSLLAVGHSKGAAAMLLAEADAPGTFTRMWVFEPVVIPRDTPLGARPDFPLAVGARRRRNEWASPTEALEAYAARPPLDALDPAVLEAYIDYGLRRRDDGLWELKCAPDDEADTYTQAPAHRLWLRLGEISAEVKVVCGERTDAVTPALGARVVERLQHATLEVMPGVGHFGPLEDVDAAVASILAFS